MVATAKQSQVKWCKYTHSKKHKVSPCVVDNPSYYSVSVPRRDPVWSRSFVVFSWFLTAHLLSFFVQLESGLVEIKDPIQRAMVRLLWKAVIPIQAQARRFLVQEVTIRRICAVLTIQSVSCCL